MYNASKVISALFGRVGWEQPTQAEYAILTEPNTLSKSGRYFQSVHAAVTIRNIKDTNGDKDISDVDFNQALVNFQRAAILRVVSNIFKDREVVDTVQTFDRETNSPDEVVANTGKFVGCKITIAPNTEFAVALSAVSLYFTEDTSFELKCFVDNKAQAIWTKVVGAIGNELTVVPVDDLVLSYMNLITRTTDFYIGYFQDDLANDEIDNPQAYDEPIESWRYGCMWRAEFFEAAPVGTRFAVPLRNGFTSKTYGLNFEFTTYKDYTNKIVAQPQLFDEVVGLQVACMVLEQILNTPRSNDTERMSAEQLGEIDRALNQSGPTVERPYNPGLKARFETEIMKLSNSFFGQPRIETHSLPYDVYADRNTRY